MHSAFCSYRAIDMRPLQDYGHLPASTNVRSGIWKIERPRNFGWNRISRTARIALPSRNELPNQPVAALGETENTSQAAFREQWKIHPLQIVYPSTASNTANNRPPSSVMSKISTAMPLPPPAPNQCNSPKTTDCKRAATTNDHLSATRVKTNPNPRKIISSTNGKTNASMSRSRTFRSCVTLPCQPKPIQHGKVARKVSAGPVQPFQRIPRFSGRFLLTAGARETAAPAAIAIAIELSKTFPPHGNGNRGNPSPHAWAMSRRLCENARTPTTTIAAINGRAFRCVMVIFSDF